MEEENKEKDSVKKVPPPPTNIALVDKNIMLPEHAEQVNRVLSGYNAIKTLVNTVLKENVDYGMVPGTSKNTLYKAGAEKVVQLLALRAKLILVNRVLEEKYVMYEFSCEIYNKDNEFLANCIGECNSSEEKYRYGKRELTNAEKTDVEYLQKLKNENRLSKKTLGDKTIYYEKVEHSDYYNIANTISKMAQKRAYVGAVLFAAGLSEFFTQDLEDFKQ